MKFSPFRFVLTTIIVIGSIMMIGISSARLIKFYLLIDEFKVKESRLVCEQPLNNRCVVHYKIDRLGKESGDFVPFGDQFVSHPLNIGLTFKKINYGFSYELNDRRERWPALWTQLITAGLGCLGVLAWYALGGIAVLKSWLKLPFTKRGE
jgi:hypothetical protein